MTTPSLTPASDANSALHDAADHAAIIASVPASHRLMVAAQLECSRLVSGFVCAGLDAGMKPSEVEQQLASLFFGVASSAGTLIARDKTQWDIGVTALLGTARMICAGETCEQSTTGQPVLMTQTGRA
jgi:hypothetical protein